MPHIVSLAVGRDPVLLEMRTKVLRSDGYTVASSLSTTEALSLFVAAHFDLVILCHSIPKTERQALAKAFHDRSPKTPVVLVAAGFPLPDPSVDATIESTPERLLQELPKLLYQQPGWSHLEHKEL